MKKITARFFAALIWMLCGVWSPLVAETVGLFFDPATPQIAFAAGDIKTALENKQYTVVTQSLSALPVAGSGKKIVLANASDTITLSNLTAQGAPLIPILGSQAYALRTTIDSQVSYWAIGGDATGVMYGGLQLAENITANGFSNTYNTEDSPFLLNRGMKLNLPLDKRIPTYVGGWSSRSAQEAIPHVWDMAFWQTLIDQQARSRYNVLSVWVHHPFPALVKVPEYPNASLPNIQRYDGSIINLNHDQRVSFWRNVMKYAHDRGMKFYFFNWNIYVDYAKDQYPSLTQDPTNPTTIDYMSKSMKALMETYPELDGFGITSGDGMDGTSEANTTWTWNAMGKAVSDYLITNPSRNFNLIHRGVKSDPETCDVIYAPIKAVPNATFNMSAKYAMAHMYSTPTPRWTGDIDSCYNLGLKTWLTFRNDDYFYLNWGDPKFVRDFMAGIPRKDSTVVGMYIGIDGFNPSRTYFHKNPALNGQLEVERRWYMEMLWGRLSYSPGMSDDVFKNLLARRYPTVTSAASLFDAWSLASRSLPKVTELVMKNWSLDFHWYPEACWSDPGRGSGFRTISDAPGATGGFAGQDVAAGSNLANIANSAAGQLNGKKSSYAVADEMQADSAAALTLIDTIQSNGNVDLQLAINNVKQMAYLSRYYAHKIRGATYKKAGNTILAREEMGKAYGWWIPYSRSMDDNYLGDAFRNLAVLPDWRFADAAVLKEYSDLGGVGVPPIENMSTLTTSAVNGSLSLYPSGGVYFKDEVVTVTASPNFGYAFSSWGGDLGGTGSPAMLTMDTNKNVTANFVVSTGDALPWVETFTMADGTKSHGAPTSWIATRSAGDFKVAGNRLMLNGGSGSTSIEGVFETADIDIPGGTVKVSLDVQSGGGLDSGDYVKFYGIVDGGTPVQIGQTIVSGFTGTNTLTATSISGSKVKLRILTRVSAGDEFYFFDNLKVEYESAPNSFTVSTSATNGSISLNPPGGLYAAGTVVTLTANPNIGYVFASWNGDLTGSTTPTMLTVNANKSVSALFNPVMSYTLATNSINGSISLNPPGGTYTSGTVVTVSAIANPNYVFTGWSGGATGSVNPTSVIMNENKILTANFAVPVAYSLATSVANGSVTLSPPGGTYAPGTVVTVSASPNPGYAFANWSGDLTGTVNPTTITINGNKSITANLNILLLSNRNVLFVVGDIGMMNTSDQAINSRLQALGYTVQTINDEIATAASAEGKALIISSSSVGSGTLGTKFRDVAVPVINWEAFVQDDYLFTGTATTEFGTVGSQATVNIILPSHPLAAGLAAGVRAVTTTNSTFSWGLPGGTPIIVARLDDGSSRPCLYAYETGSPMSSGTAPARRVNLFLQNDTYSMLNSDGLKLFDAAVAWAIGQAIPYWIQAPVIQSGQMRIEWLGGTLQTASDLEGPWNDIPNATSPYLAPVVSPKQFFRVRQ